MSDAIDEFYTVSLRLTWWVNHRFDELLVYVTSWVPAEYPEEGWSDFEPYQPYRRIGPLARWWAKPLVSQHGVLTTVSDGLQ